MRFVYWIIRPRMFIWVNALYAALLARAFAESGNRIIDFFSCLVIAVMLHLGAALAFLMAGMLLSDAKSDTYEPLAFRLNDYVDQYVDHWFLAQEMFTGAPHFTAQTLRAQAVSYVLSMTIIVLLPIEFAVTCVIDALKWLRRIACMPFTARVPETHL